MEKRCVTRLLARGLCQHAITANTITTVNNTVKSSPRPFEEIPGPKALPVIGTLHKYLPFIGEYDMKRLSWAQEAKYKKYGPLVRENIVAGESTVWVYRPEDMAEVFKADKGVYPERWSHRALYKYRMERKDTYRTAGLLPTNGVDWHNLRKELQKDLSKPQNVIHYISDLDEMVTCFTNKIADIGYFDDALPYIGRLFLELTCLVAFDTKLKAFSEEQLHPDSLSSKLIDASITANNCILPLDNGPRLWRFFDTPLYRKFCKSTAHMEKVAVQMVNEKIENLKKGISTSERSLLEIYLSNPALDKKDVIGMACDFLLAGVDTASMSAAFAFYHLSKNPDVQEKLYKETLRLIKHKDDPIKAETLKEATYTKAVIKEVFRMNPAAIGIGRLLKVDVVLNGFLIPKGTNVVTQNQVACRLPQNFERPNDFIPDRWLRDNEESKRIHPYLVTPFGHGPRSCIARRLAEQNFQILLLRVIRNLKCSWHGQKLDVVSTPLNKPDGPVKLKFVPREGP